MDSNVCIVPTTKTDFFSVIEVYYVELLLFLVVLLRRIYLKALDDQIIFGRFYNFKNLVHYSVVLKLVFKLRFTKLTMESFPSIAGYMWGNLFILIPAEPLPKTFQVDILHGPRALTWGYERILFIILV